MEEMPRKITKPNCTYNCKTSCLRKTMAASPVNPKSHQHTRSNSLPTRTHPLISEFNDQLSKLRDFEKTSPSSTSIFQKLNGLQALAQEQHKKRFKICMLLDVCGTAIDALLKTKECTRELQSTLRRRKDSNMEIARELRNTWPQGRSKKRHCKRGLKGHAS